MGAFFVYILKASVYLAILYLFYSILLSKETFYRYNRTALLLLIPLSFILPLISGSYGCSRNVFKHYYTRQSAGNILYRKRITKQNSDRYYRGTKYLSHRDFILYHQICLHNYKTSATDSERGKIYRQRRTFSCRYLPIHCSFQLVRENSHFKSRLPKPSPRNTPTRICTHSQTSFMGFTGCRSLYRITMVQSGRLVTETRAANRT